MGIAFELVIRYCAVVRWFAMHTGTQRRCRQTSHEQRINIMRLQPHEQITFRHPSKSSEPFVNMDKQKKTHFCWSRFDMNMHTLIPGSWVACDAYVHKCRISIAVQLVNDLWIEYFFVDVRGSI